MTRFLTRGKLGLFGGFSALKSEGVSHSVVSDSLWLPVLQPTRLLCPWDSPGKNTGVGCHSFSRGSSLLTSFQYFLSHLLWVDDLGPISLREIEAIRREPLHTLRITFNNLSMSVLLTPLLSVWKDHSHTYQRPVFLLVHLISALLIKNFTADKFTLFIYKHYGHFFPTNISNRFQHLLSWFLKICYIPWPCCELLIYCVYEEILRLQQNL